MSAVTKALSVATIAVAALALASCATGASGGQPTAPSEPVGWETRLDLGVPGEVLLTRHGVEFYPACRNETLTWEGTDYFPYNPAQLDDFPDPVGVVTGASALENLVRPGWARMSAPLPVVAPPGPGDGTGTLVIYEGGHAYWQSDNGELDAWLTTAELEYNWVC